MRADLFRFVEGETVYTYTSADRSFTHNAEDYTPRRGLSRAQVESKSEMSRQSLEITFSLDDPTARHWMNDRVESKVTVSVFEYDDGDVSLQWKGRLTGTKPGKAEIVAVFESIFTSLRRTGLAGRMLRTCRHVHYGIGCGLDKEDFAVNATATAFDSYDVTVTEADSAPDGTYTGGMIEAPDGTLRFILGHVGPTLTLIRPIFSLNQEITDNGPTAVRIFPGCNRTRSVCAATFSNIERYGGFDWLPNHNPFDGI